MYASFTDESFTLPEVPFKKIEPKWRRQIVVDPTGEAPGTIVVRLQERFLYYVQPGGDALRYGVGIGKDGFLWSGRANIQYGKKWPTWTPPAEMIARKPELEKWRGGQPGGLENPLGARALYIFKDGQDTGFRVHGSPEWWTIGQAMSSGCVRMINQDVIDLYNRVNGKTPIVVGLTAFHSPLQGGSCCPPPVGVARHPLPQRGEEKPRISPLPRPAFAVWPFQRTDLIRLAAKKSGRRAAVRTPI